MTLPDVCPRDGISHCKKKACHLYVVEWRTGDEQCVIGYRSTHKQLSKSMPMEDTYAQSTRMRLEKPAGYESRPRAEPAVSKPAERKHLERQVSDSVETIETIVASPQKKPVVVLSHEEVVVNNKDTTVIESRHGDEKKDDRKRKSLDELMNLDLPDNYEKEFWE